MNEPPPTEVAPSLESLRTSYVRKLPSKMREIETAWKQGSATNAHLLAHRLAGAAGSYGFQRLGEKAKTLETALEPFASGASSIGPEERAAIERHLEDLAQEVGGCAGSVSAREDGARPGPEPEAEEEGRRRCHDLLQLAGAVRRIEEEWTGLRSGAREAASSARALSDTAREIVRLAKACRLAEIRDGARALNEALVAFHASGASADPGSAEALRVEKRISQVRQALRPSILSVDDDPAFSILLQTILSGEGYPLVTASSGEQALAAVGKALPDLILLDANMPEMDGYSVCAKLQERIETACIPVVFLTALGEEQDRARAFSVGATDYLVKPLDPTLLLEKVRLQLELRNRWRTLFLEEGAQPGEGRLAPPGPGPVEPGRPRTGGGPKPLAGPSFAEFLVRFLAEHAMPAEEKARLGRLAPEQLYSLSVQTGLSTEDIARRVALHLGLAYLERVDGEKLALGVLPTWFCLSHHIVCIESKPGNRAFALANPFRSEVVAVLASFGGAGGPPRILITHPGNIEALARPNGSTEEEALQETSVFVRSFVAFKRGEKVGVGEILEVSRDHVFVASDQLALVGAELELRFAIREPHTSRFFVLKGKVASLRKAGQGERSPTGMGVRILDLKDEDRHWLEQYVSAQPVTTSYREGARQQELLGLQSPPRYQVLALIGKGTTSQVYKALDRELNDLVALKVFKTEMTDNPEARARVYQELRLARKIRSEHVATIYEHGTIGNRDYLTMEFVPGESLRKVVADGGPMPVNRALDIALDVLEGIGAAHRLGIVHRDLKSANVILTPEGKAVVLDLGLAKRLEDPHLTRSDLIIGTPIYMAPESLTGGTVGPAADVYSFGCVLFEILTGRPPFQASSIGELVLKKLESPTPRAGDLNPTVGPELSGVVLKCMARDPADRYADASEVAGVLGDLRARLTSIPLPGPTPRGRILVGTADPEWAARIERLVEPQGFEVDRVEDGFQLLERAFSGAVAGVILDLDLPKIDGMEVAQVLRSRAETSSVPIALASDRKDLPGFASLLSKTVAFPRSLGDEDLAKSLLGMGIGPGQPHARGTP